MNFIDQVTVDGFWGERKLEFDFYDDVNFVIGINGSGKTTAINIIVAALTGDFASLARLEFSRISIKLRSTSSRKRPSVVITKSYIDESRFPFIEYEIKEAASEKPHKFSLDDFDDRAIFRHYPAHAQRDLYHRRGGIIRTPLENLVNVSWLSVHRTSIGTHKENYNGENEVSTVDRKLRELSNRLVRYFSSLEKSSSESLHNFQKEVFLSLLFRKTGKAFFSTARSLDIEEEKNALEGIFSQFMATSEGDYSQRIDKHFETLAKAKEKLMSDKPMGLTNTDISVLIGAERIDYIVEEWNKSIENQEIIFEPRDTFLKIINNMMQRKKFSINAQNELEVTTQSGKSLPLKRLSSGEKQLLIVLGEALLQEKQSWVYIADEPELSLHINWQENLVKNLRAINPNAQIIFATHSPDVVSIFGNKIFDMESML